MASSKFSKSSAVNKTKSNNFWDLDTPKGAFCLISSINVGQTGGFLDISNIPSTYQHLMIMYYLRSTTSSASDVLDMQINGDGAAGLYSRTRVFGDGGTGSSNRQNNLSAFYLDYSIPGNGSTQGVFSSGVIYCVSYADTNTNRTILSRSSSDRIGSGHVTQNSFLYRSKVAINRIRLFADSGTAWAPGSTVVIYGIKGGA